MTVPIHLFSPNMQRVYDDGVRAAAAGANILILGEEGVGKEALATWLHAASPRARKPLVAVNLAAIPVRSEMELYGSRIPGARVREGALERAHGGVLLLDELGEFDIDGLRKLRAALEARSVLPAGARKPVPADVQFFALTNRDLQGDIDAGRRSPEYLEMAGTTLFVPPLRERRSEIPWLANHFVAVQCAHSGRSPPTFSPAAMASLEVWPWPSNIWGLMVASKQAAILCEGAEIGLEHLPDQIAGR